MLNGMINQGQMKVINMILASYLVYYFFFKQGVRHNAQATVMEMLESVGVQAVSPTQKYAIAAIMLAYLFKDQLPVLSDVFEKLGFSSATPLTRLVDPKAAAVADVNSVLRSEKQEKSEQQKTAPQQKVVPPPAVQNAAPPPPPQEAPAADASGPQNSLAQNFMQPVM